MPAGALGRFQKRDRPAGETAESRIARYTIASLAQANFSYSENLIRAFCFISVVSVGHTTKVVIAAVALALMVAVGGVYYFLSTVPSPYPIPVANVTVSLPAGVPYKQLTTGTWNDRWPTWSPDGKHIAYVSDKGGSSSLYVMDPSGLHAFQASDGNEMIAYLSWNPNSTQIAYWVLNGQYSEIRVFRLSNNSTFSVPGSGPSAVQTAVSWSPDGSRIAFFSRSGGAQLQEYDIKAGTSSVVANVSGSYLTTTWASNDRIIYSSYAAGYGEILWLSLGTGAGGTVLSGAANYMTPVFGPNGTISYYSDFNPGQNSDYLVGYGGNNVWVSNGDGSNATFQYVLAHEQEGSFLIVQIPYVPGQIDVTYQPAWSPDGTKIVYTAYSSAMGYAMYLWDVTTWSTAMIGPAGVGVNAVEPSWSPNGASIAFSSNLGGFYHIWVVNSNGAAGSTAGVGGY
jgi:Tol biopolymer transport system component